jgi:inosose dehydratase
VAEILIGNAPVSWGVSGRAGEVQTPYGQVMDEIAQAGYEGTELGPYGYFPTHADALRSELGRRGLRLASSYVPVPLEHPDQAGAAVETALRVGSLLRSFGVRELIVAGTSDPHRLEVAGSVAPGGSDGWDDRQWEQVGRTLDLLARACRDELRMRLVFHHHTGTFVETPAEIERLMAITDPELVGLCLDTGHLVYGGGDAAELVRTYADRIWYVHLKDVWPDRLARVRRERMHMRRAWQMGVFAELGRGCVDFVGLADVLRSQGYRGWMIVEQDVVKDPDKPWSPLTSAIQSRTYLRESLGL